MTKISHKIEIPADLVEQVRNSAVTEDLSLTDEVTSYVAACLFDYQDRQQKIKAGEDSESNLRDAHDQKKQKRRIKTLLNSAKDTERHLNKVLADPVLSYEIESLIHPAEPDSTFIRPSEDLSAQHLYVRPGDTVDEEAFTSLLEVKDRLGRLTAALESIEVPQSPNKTGPRPKKELFMLIDQLDSAIAPHIPDRFGKIDRAVVIREFLSMIDETPSAKTIQNLLS